MGTTLEGESALFETLMGRGQHHDGNRIRGLHDLSFTRLEDRDVATIAQDLRAELNRFITKHLEGVRPTLGLLTANDGPDQNINGTIAAFEAARHELEGKILNRSERTPEAAAERNFAIGLNEAVEKHLLTLRSSVDHRGEASRSDLGMLIEESISLKAGLARFLEQSDEVRVQIALASRSVRSRES